MKKRNKKYNPNKHSIKADSFLNAINLSQPVSNQAKDRLNIGIHAALLAFTQGVATKLHFDTLASTVDLCLLASTNLFKNAYLDEIHNARDAMIRCKDRYERTHKLGFDGEGLNAMKLAIDIHDELINNVTGAEVLNFLKQRDHHIRSGNYYKGAEEHRAAA